jgi:hypothetical protein
MTDLEQLVERLNNIALGKLTNGRLAGPDTVMELARVSAAMLTRQAAETERLREVMVRCAEIVDRNLYHQHEKIEDVPHLIRAALSPDESPASP